MKFPTSTEILPSEPYRSRFVSIAVVSLLLLLGISIFGGSWYTVDQTERAVLLRNGAFVDVEDPGLHFKLPWFESVVKVGLYQRSVRWDTSTGQDARQEAYSYDQQPANLSISVVWHVPADAVDQLYQQYRTEDGAESNLIDRRIPPAIKTVFGQFTAVSAIQDRAKLNVEILKAVMSDPDIARHQLRSTACRSRTSSSRRLTSSRSKERCRRVSKCSASSSKNSSSKSRPTSRSSMRRLRPTRRSLRLQRKRRRRSCVARLKHQQSELRATRCATTRNSLSSPGLNDGTVSCRRRCCRTASFHFLE